ncbi:MAG: YheU family protein [Bdellovibrionaceae bacterium]|nr:YheU family protein [Pseudobdellovibrionaceae bacterium]
MEVPIDKLSPEIIQSLIEEFILREGTDYGAVEASLEKKKEQVSKQLENEDIKIVFDPNTESVTLMTAHQFIKATRDIK